MNAGKAANRIMELEEALSAKDAELAALRGELEKERSLNDKWHKEHWTADMEAVNSYKRIAEKAEKEVAGLKKRS